MENASGTSFRKPFGLTRREVLKTAGAGAVLLATPQVLRAATSAQYIRPSMTSAEGIAHLETYRKAVATMWALPPEDPHNWFRYAMIHLMDCPHGNWWFFVWHRPYVANLEQIIRIYGEDDSFAMPYWDWTADPFVPDTFFSSDTYPDNALDPTSGHFPNWVSFEEKYFYAIEAFWNGLSDAQLQQEAERGFKDFDSFWFGPNGIKANFTEMRENARSKTLSAPALTYPADEAVKLPVIEAGLTPEAFTTVVGTSKAVVGFNSPESENHHVGVGSAIIEGQPHNKVHNDLGGAEGGWMPSLLSSVDPIFFMHHCNVDRIWDVWTTKERAAERSGLPTRDEVVSFNPEPFLFYINAAGVFAPSTAGASMEIEPWGYAYTPGSGSAKPPLLLAGGGVDTAVGAEANADFALQKGASARLSLSEAFASAAATQGARQIAQVTFTPPMFVKGLSFEIFIAAKGAQPDLSENSPDFAGSFEFFGMNMSHGHNFTATIDITDAVSRLKAIGALAAQETVSVTLMAKRADGSVAAEKSLTVDNVKGVLKSVSLETI